MVESDLTVAEALRDAATLLHEAVAAFRAEERDPYWGGGFFRGIDNAVGGPGGRLAGLFGPELAESLAFLLEEKAEGADIRGAQLVHLGPSALYPLAVADGLGEVLPELTHAWQAAQHVRETAKLAG
ncbi:hypothetical protein [Nonomuraea bangladeshensis]|uniref:hypothetical protein n=1 Tax=Nonomuraea bangladeshensis TaxID=404385 RepID=UPI003C2DB99C